MESQEMFNPQKGKKRGMENEKQREQTENI